MSTFGSNLNVGGQKTIISEKSVWLCFTFCFNVTFDHYIQLPSSICIVLLIPFHNPQILITL
ncbi:hypothetical protein OUZ56_029968 [Daphnia magna]|uniref:Uncharacterized protein n=1 Tax=Daphnia magna TaxID=35525 RepID=A0ABR0B8E7_9CRUS|nr:hypothetical protein OUZ56_029968 [Daphnia magna]